MAIRAIDVLSSFVLISLYIEIIKIMSGVEMNWTERWSKTLIFWILNSALILAVGHLTLLKIPIMFVSHIIAGKLIYKRVSLPIVLFCAFIYFIPGVLSDNLFFYIFSMLNLSIVEVKESVHLMIFTNCTLILIQVLELIVLKYLINRFGYAKEDDSLTSWNKYIGVAFTLLVVNIYIISMYKVGENIIDKYIWIIPVTFLVVVIFATYSQYLVKTKEYKNSQLHYYLKTMSKLSNDIKQFKHDFNNILISLYGLADKEEWQTLKERLAELQGSRITQYSSDIEAMVNIREPSLISLLAAKMFYANKHNINFFIEAPHVVESMPIKGTDFIRIVGILLDNAIEASKNCENPEVGAIFLSYKDYFELIITNSISDINLEVAAIDKDGYSTKGLGRGTGLSSLASMLENYMPVEWNTVVKNNKFMQCIGFKRK